MTAIGIIGMIILFLAYLVAMYILLRFFTIHAEKKFMKRNEEEEKIEEYFAKYNMNYKEKDDNDEGSR